MLISNASDEKISDVQASQTMFSTLRGKIDDDELQRLINTSVIIDYLRAMRLTFSFFFSEIRA
jgi:hypothetical protein